MEKLSGTNFRIGGVDTYKGNRVVHVNRLKLFRPRGEENKEGTKKTGEEGEKRGEIRGPNGDDITAIKGHRRMGNKVEYLAETDEELRWVSRQELEDSEKLDEYLKTLEGPVMRSMKSKSNTVIANRRVMGTVGLISKCMILLYIFSMMWGGIYGVKPDLGSLYDCSVATQDHVLGMPKDIGCNHKFEANKVRKYSAEVMQYDPMETDIKLYKCSVKKVILKCFEKLFGSDEKSRSTSAITVTSQQCRQAVKTKQSSYGPISLLGIGVFGLQQLIKDINANG